MNTPRPGTKVTRYTRRLLPRPRNGWMALKASQPGKCIPAERQQNETEAS